MCNIPLGKNTIQRLTRFYLAFHLRMSEGEEKLCDEKNIVAIFIACRYRPCMSFDDDKEGDGKGDAIGIEKAMPMALGLILPTTYDYIS